MIPAETPTKREVFSTWRGGRPLLTQPLTFISKYQFISN
jgi:hypothetical protein